MSNSEQLYVVYSINAIIAATAIYVTVCLSINLSKFDLKLIRLYASPEKKLAILSRILCLSVAVLILFRCFLYLGFIKLVELVHNDEKLSDQERKEGDLICSVMLISDVLSLTIATGLIYVFLWTRQGILYFHQQLKFLSNKLVRSVSFFVIILWCLYYIVILTCYLVFVRHKADKNYLCTTVNANAEMWSGAIIISWTVATVIMEIALLGLFSYPFLKQKSWSKKTKTGSASSSLLLFRVKKAMGLAIVTSLLDIGSFAFSYVVGGPPTNVVFNLNLMIKIFIAIAYFDYWRRILCPWKKKIPLMTVKVRANTNPTQITSISGQNHIAIR